jgi:Cu/Ag efflux protein CusF
MRNLVLPLLLVAALGASSGVMAAGYGSSSGTMAAPTTPAPMAQAPAMAAPMHFRTARGTIKLIDAKACLVTLTSRNVYQFEPKCDFSKLKVGERVSIKWEPKGKVRDAMAIASR